MSEFTFLHEDENTPFLKKVGLGLWLAAYCIAMLGIGMADMVARSLFGDDFVNNQWNRLLGIVARKNLSIEKVIELNFNQKVDEYGGNRKKAAKYIIEEIKVAIEKLEKSKLKSRKDTTKIDEQIKELKRLMSIYEKI